jgi:hypothetical protein
MLKGIEHLRRTREILAHTDLDDPRQRLLAAARYFWSAVFDLQQWPPPLQQEAEALIRTLFAAGVIERTIRRMDEATIAATAGQLAAFVERAELVNRES